MSGRLRGWPCGPRETKLPEQPCQPCQVLSCFSTLRVCCAGSSVRVRAAMYVCVVRATPERPPMHIVCQLSSRAPDVLLCGLQLVLPDVTGRDSGH